MNARDPYSYPDVDVLRNKAGIRDAEKLRQFEYRKTLNRALEIDRTPIQRGFDLKHLQDIHHHLFQDVYDWAGKIRTVNISKEGSAFARTHLIESYGGWIFGELKKENFLQNLEKPQFVKRLSHHFAEINALHPFREGNGRSTREFISQLAKSAGYEVDYTKVGKDRWNSAARASFQGEINMMEGVFGDIVRESREHSQLRGAPGTEPDAATVRILNEAIEAKLAQHGLSAKERDIVKARIQQHLFGTSERAGSFIERGGDGQIKQPTLKEREQER